MKATKYLLQGTLVSLMVFVLLFNSCQKEKDQVKEKEQSASSASSEHGMGCLILPASEYKAIALAPEVHLKAVKPEVYLPCPPIDQQGEEGSCVAWGTTYACRSISYKITSGAIDSGYSYGMNIFSPEYVYNQIKISSDCKSGAYVTSALNLLIDQGVCPWSVMPYIEGNGCSTLPTEDKKAIAAQYKIADYSRVTISVSTLKAQLSLNKPVIIAGPVDKAYSNLRSNEMLTKYDSSTYLGGHCVCLVGYSDALKAFKFQNSWGYNWGTQGFGWMSYDAISGYIKEAYILIEK